MSQRWPNLMIIGSVKAGTTSLYTYLAAHPDFCGSSMKETLHFTPDVFNPSEPRLDRYARFFAHATDQRYVFEATANYCHGGAETAQFLKAIFPDLKAVLLLRDPADRARSFFEFEKAMLRLPPEMTFSAYIDACLERQAAGGHLGSYEGVWRGFYARTLPDWLDAFGDDLHIGWFEDLRRDPASFTDGLCRWLGVPPASEVGVAFTKENATVQPRNRELHRLALGVNKTLEPFLRANHGVKRRLRDAYRLLNADRSRPTAVAPQDMARLRDIFAAPNRELEACLDRHRPGLARPDWLMERTRAA